MSFLDPAGSAAADRPWTLWSVLRRPDRSTTGDHPAGGPALAELVSAPATEASAGVTLRGFYDVSGLRADADLMVWLHGTSAQALQAAQRELRRSAELEALVPTWSAMGVHRPAEFSASHEPAYLRGAEPKEWLTVYPFVRSYEWYLLEDGERRAMLAEHGKMARDYKDVRANTVASFALGDYEWMLAFEADELYRIVDLMRHLRGSTARRHVREEVPFYTGALTAVPDLLHRLP